MNQLHKYGDRVQIVNNRFPADDSYLGKQGFFQGTKDGQLLVKIDGHRTWPFYPEEVEFIKTPEGNKQ